MSQKCLEFSSDYNDIGCAEVAVTVFTRYILCGLRVGLGLMLVLRYRIFRGYSINDKFHLVDTVTATSPAHPVIISSLFVVAF